MADRKKKSWGTFKNEMKAKRRKTGDGGGKKNEKGNILELRSIRESPKIYLSGAT